MKNIRILGDPILQKKGKEFPIPFNQHQWNELLHQIALAKKILIDSGGAGIAANQCADILNPYQFTIVGVFHENPTHVAHVEKRYPGTQFPEAIVMINPTIVESSQEEMTFFHGCLSVPGQLRAEVKNPKEMTVNYLTINNQNQLHSVVSTFKNNDAVVLRHELNHILLGKTYIDCCLHELSSDDLKLLSQMLHNEINKRKSEPRTHNLSPDQAFYRFIIIDKKGRVRLDPTVFQKALEQSVTTEMLHTLSSIINSSSHK